MKTLYVFIIIIIVCKIPPIASAQEVKNPYDVNFKVNYNQEAHYPEGEEAFYRYIFNNIEYSEEAKKNKIESKVLVFFDVMPDSTLTNILIINPPGYGIDEEIKRLLTSIKFSPAIANSQAIRQNVMFTIPIRAGAGSK